MGLEVRSSFGVDAPRPDVWSFLTDIERAAPCFPGTELGARRDDGQYDGAFSVKLGPMGFRFAGRFGFESQDPQAAVVIVRATGADAKGRGSASARIRCELVDTPAGGTQVSILSTVDLSGAVAQYGRSSGMIEALSKQLVDQFAARVAQQLREERKAAAPASQPESGAPAPDAAHRPPAGRIEPQAVSAVALLAGALRSVLAGWWSRLIRRRG
jgi:uncharacterized protein